MWAMLDCKEIKPVNPKGNQSWIFIGRTDDEAGAPVLWPPLMQRADTLEKTLMLGKIEGRRRRQQRRVSGITDSMDTSLGKLWRYWRTGKPGKLQSMGSQRVRHDLATEQQLQQAGEPEVGLRILIPKTELLWYTYSPVCGSPTHLGGMGFILSQVRPSYHLIAVSSLSLEHLFW